MSKAGAPSRRLGSFFGAVALAAAVLVPGAAFAAGSIVAKTTQLDEVDGKWRLQLTIDLGSVPDLNYVPMKFVFTPTAYDERYCDEAHPAPTHQRKSLMNQPAIPVDEEVGFTDSMGKALRKTKFDFSIPRNENFEAGEYTLEVKKDDQTIGTKMTITLKGDNRIVDRRPMVLAGDNRPKKDDPCANAPESSPSTGEKSTANAGSNGDKGSDASKGTDSSTSGGDGSSGTPPESGQPGAETPKQGGCRCELAGASGGESVGAVLALGLAVGAGLRRRKMPRRA